MLSDLDAKKREYQDLIDTAVRKGKAHDIMRLACLSDLYFLLVYVLKQRHMAQGPEYKQAWLFDRCREVQASPDWCLDLWAREHYKSTIVTFGKTIQDVLTDPELTVGIFSFNRPIAKQFLNQIKRELEQNATIKKIFPDVLWQNPDRDAPKWSENDGIMVKRTQNPREATIEAWGLIDGQPTSKHFGLMVYDDIVTEDTVRSPEVMKKVTKSWELSINLSKEGGRQRYVGTIYHAADTYSTIRAKGICTTRVHPGTADGTMAGDPVLFSPEYMAVKRKGMSNYVFSCQILLNPQADNVGGFDETWIREWNATEFNHLNLYLLVDPAGSKKKKGNDYTCMCVVGLGPDRNYYVVDWVRDRLNLTERTTRVFQLHRKYRPLAVGYEQYGMQSDIEHIQDIQARENYRFDITELKGKLAKNERISRLSPLFEQGRMYLPWRCLHIDYEGHQQDLARNFIDEEFKAWPYGAHDDMMDCLSRICDEDLGAEFPLDDTLPGEDGMHHYAESDYNELEYGRRAA